MGVIGGSLKKGGHVCMVDGHSSASGLSSISLQSREDGLPGVVLRAREGPLQALRKCQSDPVPLRAAARGR